MQSWGDNLNREEHRNSTTKIANKCLKMPQQCLMQTQEWYCTEISQPCCHMSHIKTIENSTVCQAVAQDDFSWKVEHFCRAFTNKDLHLSEQANDSFSQIQIRILIHIEVDNEIQIQLWYQIQNQIQTALLKFILGSDQNSGQNTRKYELRSDMKMEFSWCSNSCCRSVQFENGDVNIFRVTFITPGSSS